MNKNLWSGRFKKGMHPVFQCFSYSLVTDFALLEAEIKVDIAWAKMLARVKLISSAESSRLVKGLNAIYRDLAPRARHSSAPSDLLQKYEDIHTLIQTQLEKKIGAVGKKIHTGRSRNDLVVTSTRLYLREKLDDLASKIRGAQKALVVLAKKSGELIIPGMTHWKKAQPVLLAHHLLAYCEMLEEDLSRLKDTRKRVNVLPLGSAAIAGSALPLDRDFVARQLGFEKVSSNSLTATGDRGFIAEFLADLAILWTHLSRLSEDFIHWNSEYLNFIELDDAFATGSSLMPQKKNLDIFELLRGRSSVIFGYLQSILTLQKGLPLAYNRDLQEDKPGLFDAVRKTELALELLALTLGGVSFNRKAIQTSVEDSNLFATDVVEYLVRKKVPFAEAHGAVGKAVRFAGEAGKNLSELTIQDWNKFSSKIDSDIYDLFDPLVSVSNKKTFGSTNPKMVKREIARWEKILK